MTEPSDPLAPFIARLKEPVELSPHFTERVMLAVADADLATADRAAVRLDEFAPPGTGSPVPWWRRRVTVRVSPIGGLALAAGLAALVVGARELGRSEFRRRPAAGELADAPMSGVALASARSAADTEAPRPTQFVLVAPEAASVSLVGDFNEWDLAATPLVRAEGNGVWSVVVPLRPGRYRYAFVVNGAIWRGDPEAPAQESEFGQPNSVLTIGGA